MKLSIGIVGLPNVGKSTLFNALTKKQVPSENYPFCTIDPSVGVVPVPDERLLQLSELSHSAKTIPAVVDFVDIAGLVKGASDGEGLGNQFLAHIRETDAIAQVVRIFEDDEVIHVDGNINPMHDISVINLELVLADFQTVSKRRTALQKDIKRGDAGAVALDAVLGKIATALDAGKLASSVELNEDEEGLLAPMQLLTKKPMLYVLNKKTGAKNLDDEVTERFIELQTFLQNENAPFVILDAGLERELSGIDDATEREDMRKDLSESNSLDAVDSLISLAYEKLNLISFFTTGEDESRAWTIVRGDTAPQAGAAIHTDFKDKFIKADVIAWDTLLACTSYQRAKEEGKVRLEGKEYVVQSGDVIEFRHGQ